MFRKLKFCLGGKKRETGRAGKWGELEYLLAENWKETGNHEERRKKKIQLLLGEHVKQIKCFFS